MTGPKKTEGQDNKLSEDEKRKLKSQQEKENQRREDQSRKDSTHDNQSQKDKQIAPEQRGQDSR